MSLFIENRMDGYLLMKKVAIMTDSNSGITQQQGKDLGIFVVPMPFVIDQKTYFEDIDLSQEDFYKLLMEDSDIMTTQPTPDSYMQMWDKALEEYDEIVYIPMSSGLSGSCSSAYTMSTYERFEGKIFVVDNQRISVTLRQSVYDAIEFAKRGYDGAQIRDALMQTKWDSTIYIMVDTLKYLKKGGRVTPAAAALGTLLKLKPVLQIHGEKLDAYAKARTVVQAKSIMIDAAKKDIASFLGNDYKNVWLEIAYTKDAELANSFRDEITEAFPGYPKEDIMINPLSLSVSCHIGENALAIAVCKKIDYDNFKLNEE